MKKSSRIFVTSLAAGIAALVFVGVYYLTPVGAIDRNMSQSFVHWDAARAARLSDEIVVGEVVSVERIVLDEFFRYTDEDTGEQVADPRTNLYYKVTIEVEEYLKDDGGDGSVGLVFRDPIVQGIFFVDGVKYNIVNGDASEYTVGEKAVFFLRYVPDMSWLHAAGTTAKFTIDDAGGTAQSKQREILGESPIALDEFKNQIRSLVAEQQ